MVTKKKCPPLLRLVKDDVMIHISGKILKSAVRECVVFTYPILSELNYIPRNEIVVC